MKNFMKIVQLCISVALALLMAAMTTSQWIIAGEFRWFIGLFIVMTIISFILAQEAYKEWKQNKNNKNW